MARVFVRLKIAGSFGFVTMTGESRPVKKKASLLWRMSPWIAIKEPMATAFASKKRKKAKARGCHARMERVPKSATRGLGGPVTVLGNPVRDLYATGGGAIQYRYRAALRLKHGQVPELQAFMTFQADAESVMAEEGEGR